jgi:hypothetical protein
MASTIEHEPILLDPPEAPDTKLRETGKYLTIWPILLETRLWAFYDQHFLEALSRQVQPWYPEGDVFLLLTQEARQVVVGKLEHSLTQIITIWVEEATDNSTPLTTEGLIRALDESDIWPQSLNFIRCLQPSDHRLSPFQLTYHLIRSILAQWFEEARYLRRKHTVGKDRDPITAIDLFEALLSNPDLARLFRTHHLPE